MSTKVHELEIFSSPMALSISRETSEHNQNLALTSSLLEMINGLRYDPFDRSATKNITAYCQRSALKI